MTPPFGVYVHVPFCASRCGYCDFNTYTPAELRDPAGGVSRGSDSDSYVAAAVRELQLAANDPGGAAAGGAAQTVSTIFFGGGTPSLLTPVQLQQILQAIGESWQVADDCEITLEANPDTVTAELIARWQELGINRVSLGVQSAVPSVLQRLDRTHNPANVADVCGLLRTAGMEFSLDLIYGTPGESVADWRESVEAAIVQQPGHISAYALTVEPGTALHRRVRHGEFDDVCADDQAEKYELVDDLLTAAGYSWYEISNWAHSEHQQCRHNVGYWQGGCWWGAGPGAHSYGPDAAGDLTRWWNVKHPRQYADMLADNQLPIADREHLDADAVALETVMLGIRCRTGLAVADAPTPEVIPELIAAGLVHVQPTGEPSRDGASAAGGDRLVLTRQGRLLADTVVRRLTGD